MSTAAELEAAGVAFVEATVVRCASPTSARPGDRALVLGDGTIEGFVGGSCADATVRLQALRAMETGEPVLLRILPGIEEGPAGEEGAVVVNNPCLSGGALELFLEPHLPAPSVAITGDSPIALTIEDLAPRVGFRIRTGAPAESGDFGAVVASLGHGDEEALRAALDAGAEYIGLVASRRRGAGVLDHLRAAGVPDHDLARIRTPAGLDIGAKTHEEIALSIVAELVAVRRAHALPPEGGQSPTHALNMSRTPQSGTTTGNVGSSDPGGGLSPSSDPGGGLSPSSGLNVREAVDPVCGMTVAVGPGTPTAGDEAFCCEGCRDTWLRRSEAHASGR